MRPGFLFHNSSFGLVVGYLKLPSHWLWSDKKDYRHSLRPDFFKMSGTTTSGANVYPPDLSLFSGSLKKPPRVRPDERGTIVNLLD